MTRKRRPGLKCPQSRPGRTFAFANDASHCLVGYVSGVCAILDVHSGQQLDSSESWIHGQSSSGRFLARWPAGAGERRERAAIHALAVGLAGPQEGRSDRKAGRDRSRVFARWAIRVHPGHLPLYVLTLWDAADSSSPRKSWEKFPDKHADNLAISFNGTRILVVDDLRLSLRSAATGDEIWASNGDSNLRVKSMVISPDGRLAALVSRDDPAICIWRLPEP